MADPGEKKTDYIYWARKWFRHLQTFSSYLFSSFNNTKHTIRVNKLLDLKSNQKALLKYHHSSIFSSSEFFNPLTLP